MTNRRPRLGASFQEGCTSFRVWAPDARTVEVFLEAAEGQIAVHQMEKGHDGYFAAVIPGVAAGDFYRYRIDGRGPFPDPASRYQPRGVHGPSMVVNPASYQWTDKDWTGIPLQELVLYELHVGTFTPPGTFCAAAARLPALRELGVTAVELMPVAEFAGDRNWGYDGVALFAPARCYGTPDDLRSLVDTAHGLGLAVFLDVVYNHFGPDGAYQSQFSRHYFSQAQRSPWGDGINFDGPRSGPVRDYFIENALQWIHEYHLDGLRLDATHAIADESPRHILASISLAVQTSVAGMGRCVHVMAEDVRNLACMVQPASSNGWGLDAVWSDDFHHQTRRALVGDSDGYFQDFDGSAGAIAETAEQGWFYRGQYATFFGKSRGTDPSGIAYPRFVFFIQNHDQIGNRAFGDRLHHAIGLAAYRAASVLLLLLPETPLLFMGQEWAATTPFLYFTEHRAELGKLVTEGRRREFSRFAAFADPAKRELIPDPQQPGTFEASRLVWEERDREPHASMLRLYRSLLALRRSDPALGSRGQSGELPIAGYNDDVLLLRRASPREDILLAVIRLRGSGMVDLGQSWLAALAPGRRWELAWTTEDPTFAPDSAPPEADPVIPAITFARPGAVLLRSTGKERD